MSEDNKLYSENMIYIEDIVDSMRKNSFTFFCGSGATADATGATWTDLFKKELEVIDKEESDCYRLAQYYEQHFGREKLINHITNIFSRKNESKHINALLQLPVYEFWTTNYDKIIENTIENKTNLLPSIIYNSQNLVKINENKKYKVFKMNGSISDSRSMVVTSNDYSNYKKSQCVLIEFFKRELILKSFLFIGYSFKDNLVLSCLDEIKDCFPNLDHFHYRIDVTNEKHKTYQKIEKEYFEKNYNIRTIYVDSFEQIDTLINMIYKKFKSKNIFISGSFRDIGKKEDLANEICKSIVENLLDNGFNIYSGDGKRLGSYVISNATKKLMDLTSTYQHNRLTIMPYIDHTFKHKDAFDGKRTSLVDKMIKDCSIAIFLYGQNEEGKASKGVELEYKRAKENSLYTIPIPTTGFAAEKIYNDLITNDKPWYLDKYYKKLETANNPDDISKIILEIINLINSI